MKKPIPTAGTRCVVCGKPIKIGEDYEFSKGKRIKITFFHTKCYENLKKKG
jgi:hypothetical protein